MIENDKYENLKGIDVFLERYRDRLYVGRLICETVETKPFLYIFTYDKNYLKSKNVFPLGVEFPLTKQRFESPTLFESFKDRIPDRANPAYGEYCALMEIDEKTENELLLLSTIGKRGPSSFIFEPYVREYFSFDKCNDWRKDLNFSIKDFCAFFGISSSVFQKMKANKTSGRDVLNYLKLFWKFKENFKYLLETRGKYLHPRKLQSAYDWFLKHFKQEQ
jgi:HipA-like protein